MSDLEGKHTYEEKLFAVRTENQVLMDKIRLLEYQIEYIKKHKRSGKIRIIIDQLSDDLKFMKEAGDLFFRVCYLFLQAKIYLDKFLLISFKVFTISLRLLFTSSSVAFIVGILLYAV